jgi:DNA polymerase III delta prime subunit
MENINEILNRKEQENEIKSILKHFYENKNNLLLKKGIYIYGDPGIGKTTFINKILQDLNYDIIHYDAGDVRNTAVIENITKNKMAENNILSLFNKTKKKIIIIMDEIDGMNNGDKGGINKLITLIRPKKTKKQKLEETTIIPIICIGNYQTDKKIKDLMKVCHVIQLNVPTNQQISNILDCMLDIKDASLKNTFVKYIHGDLTKLNNLCFIYKNDPTFFTQDRINTIFQSKMNNDNNKLITKKLINNYYSIDKHLQTINETDRTSVGLLWHENIIDTIQEVDKKYSIPFYLEQLNNICFADYIDRITFQKQIWQFNELSSLIKIFKNNKAYHNFEHKTKNTSNDIRFTKVLTKYSTEYNNLLFIQKLCQKLNMDKSDLFGYFMYLKTKYSDVQIIELLNNYDISKLEINRMYKYLDKFIKEDAIGIDDADIEEDFFEEEEDVDFI